jgi:hypothetical protein
MRNVGYRYSVFIIRGGGHDTDPLFQVTGHKTNQNETCYSILTYSFKSHRLISDKYRAIQKHRPNFVQLYFRNYISYVDDLHNT